MKRFRKRILEVKEGFLDAKIKNVAEACILVNIFVISFIAVVILCLLTIFIKFNLNNIFYITSSILLVSDIFFLFNFRAFAIVLSFSTKILLHFFGRYGRVVTKNDWTRIKKEYPKVYRKIWSKKSYGHCYDYSMIIAYFLEDAQLMYCSVKKRDGRGTGHAVIVKNSCVYDTNLRQHFDLEEYKKRFGVNVYKMFSEEEYKTEYFFDNIRDGFVKWCAERDVYCNF